MNFFEQYAYVDAWWDHTFSGGSRSKWHRILARDVVRSIIGPSGNQNCFGSAQRFRDSTRLRDYSLTAKPTEDGRSVPTTTTADGSPIPTDGVDNDHNDEQLHYHGLYFDFDATPATGESDATAIERARHDAVEVATFFTQGFEFHEPWVQVWFSGRKGFHIVVRPEPFDIRPHSHLTKIVKRIALDLAARFDLKTLDQMVYSIPRLWRLPNSRHWSTDLYKVELSIAELVTLRSDQIIQLAKQPRIGEQAQNPALPLSDIYPVAEYEKIDVRVDAKKWYEEYVDSWQAADAMARLRPRLPVIRPEGEDLPVCMIDVTTNGPKPGGARRNRVLLAMAGFWKDAGIDKVEAHYKAREWTQRHFPDPRDLRDRLANAKTQIDSVYAGSIYQFSCAYILSTRGPGPEGKIACAGADCKWIRNPEDQRRKNLEETNLAAATDGKFIGSQILVPVHVASIVGQPFGVPVEGHVRCQPDPDSALCLECGVYQRQQKQLAGTLTPQSRHPVGKEEEGGFWKQPWRFTVGTRETLKLFRTPDNQVKGAIKGYLGINAKCNAPRHTLHMTTHMNVEEIQVIPAIGVKTRVHEDPDLSENTKSAYYVSRRAFYLGGANGISENRKYWVKPYVFEHPEKQEVVLLFQEPEPAEDDVSDFKMTPELYDQLTIFQRGTGQTVQEKLEEIHADLAENVHRIHGRFPLVAAIDLCYHSVIGFRFEGRDVVKGWWELLILGDSGTGKTTVVEQLIRHYGLGELIAGEGNKRTGLIWSANQLSSGNWSINWGKIPQNDRRLLVIDEFAALPPEEIALMTQIRSDGRARGQGVVGHHEAWARTRLIFLTNPKNGRQLAEFNYGIDAINDIFEEHQDLRRVDLALTARKDDVEQQVYNRRYDGVKVDHRFTHDLCKKLILWAWSRGSRDVQWMPGAEDKVLEWATKIGDTYRCDIPLAQDTDMRYKIARISVSVAARLFSTDGEGRVLQVFPEHVEWAAQFMDALYRKPSMAFQQYAKMYQQENTFSAAKMDQIRRRIKEFPNPDELVATLLRASYLLKQELADMTSYEKDVSDALWRFLISHQLIRRVGKGYRKTAAFTEFLRQIGSTMSGYAAGGGSGEGSTSTSSTLDDIRRMGDDPPPFDDD